MGKKLSHRCCIMRYYLPEIIYLHFDTWLDALFSRIVVFFDKFGYRSYKKKIFKINSNKSYQRKRNLDWYFQGKTTSSNIIMRWLITDKSSCWSESGVPRIFPFRNGVVICFCMIKQNTLTQTKRNSSDKRRNRLSAVSESLRETLFPSIDADVASNIQFYMLKKFTFTDAYNSFIVAVLMLI